MARCVGLVVLVTNMLSLTRQIGQNNAENCRISDNIFITVPLNILRLSRSDNIFIRQLGIIIEPYFL